MPQTVRVNFHRHSSRSDGLLSPERLAGALADAGAVAAALTDHDTTEGLQPSGMNSPRANWGRRPCASVFSPWAAKGAANRRS